MCLFESVFVQQCVRGRDLFCGWLEGLIPFVDLHERVSFEWPLRACRAMTCAMRDVGDSHKRECH